MAVTLCRRALLAVGHGGRAWWYHYLDAIAMRCDRLVGGRAVIHAVGRHPDDRTVDLIRQRGDLRWIVGVLIRQGLRHDHAARGIDRQMQFALFPARLRAMFRLQPLARPVDLQTAAVDQQVIGPFGVLAGWITGKFTARRLTVV